MEVISHLTEKAQRDYKLVIRARESGDQNAYADLMKHYQETLYYIMLRMTSNATDAEDMTIEAFARAFRNLDNYTCDYAFSTWLFKIASNNCIDFLRRNKRLPFADPHPANEPGDSETYEVPCLEPTPEEMIIEKQRIKVMREVVDRMKPHYRKLVELRYFKEWSYEEIARELHLPLGTVKAKLFRSRDMLHQILKSKLDHI